MSEEVKVVFNQNTTDEETKVNYWAGQEADLPPENAERIVSKGFAEYAEEEPAPE